MSPKFHDSMKTFYEAPQDRQTEGEKWKFNVNIN